MNNYLLIIFIIYLLLINFVSIIVTVLDRQKAKKHKWRIKESTLLIFSALGGSVCMYITMLLIHHKTRHLKFMVGIPVIFVIQVLLLSFILVSCYGK